MDPFLRQSDGYLKTITPKEAYDAGLHDGHTDVVPGILIVLVLGLVVSAVYLILASIYTKVRDDIAKAFARAGEDEAEKRGWTLERMNAPPGPMEVIIVDGKPVDVTTK